MRRALVFVSIAVLVLLAPGCKGGGGNRRRDEPAPAPEPARQPREAAEPLPAYAAEPHHWIYYPDEPLYFCDRHQHHWIKAGRRWKHVEQYDARPNYAAHILANQGEFEIHAKHDEHAREFPPGSRRR
jgi:hypothetical protein